MLYDIFSSFLKQTDPEFAHQLAIKFLKNSFLPFDFFKSKDKDNLKQNIFNLTFNNPVGLAAGFDKNAEVYNSFYKLGFGFAEVGTITPKPQDGNPKPRVFRLVEDKAIINRLGFPNEGMDIIKNRILGQSAKGILGINIGPNKENATKIDDYLKCFEGFYDLASYITINISSPNTPNLRNLHDINKISELIDAISSLRQSKNSNVPILYKLSPDIQKDEVEKLSEVFINKKIDGLILTNTSIQNKEHLTSDHKKENGGLSGSPINQISNEIIRSFFKYLKKQIPIIGVGGVSDAETAYKKIKCGASLLQLYTSMIFKGPYVASSINEDLSYLLEKDGFKNISEAVGVNTN
jgi:dihydroorotate dehydrogenase